MKILRYDISSDKYNINCITYEPEVCACQFAVICLHGFGGDKESSAIKCLAQAITDNGGAVVAFDFASHGKSDADEKYLTVENCVSDA